ncbi:50S ribosomal protein L31 [Ellagibacter isourolithinifaciens]|uniref:50S ribosomal protein L31 n=1 Tax=Ellagibacter isourolithinifaciens TaxID=2137581 RepID=UPI003A9478DB
MKQGIHPDYVECTVKCTCGNTFTTRSTKSELRVDICNACHPFFTGQQKFIDTGGRVQRFADKFGSAKDMVAEREKKAAEKAKRAEEYAKKAEEEAARAAEAAATAEAEGSAEEAAADAEAEAALEVEAPAAE